MFDHEVIFKGPLKEKLLKKSNSKLNIQWKIWFKQKILLKAQAFRTGWTRNKDLEAVMQVVVKGLGLNCFLQRKLYKVRCEERKTTE